MAYLTRDEFAARAREAVPLRPVEVDGIGTVAVQAMTGLDLQDYYNAEIGAEDRTDAETVAYMRGWIARLVVDEDRAPLFSGPDDPSLMALDIERLMDFAVAVMGAAGIGATDDEEGDSEGKARPSESGGSD